MIIRAIVMILVITGILETSLATQLMGNQEERLRVDIGKNGLNRITMKPWRIVQVTGDDTKYRLIHDDDGRNIYLMPKVGVGELIEVSLRNDFGEVQDLELKVSNIKGQSIVIQSKRKEQDKDIKQEVFAMMKAMMRGHDGKYFVEKKQRNIKNKYGVVITQIKSYRYGDLSGGIFELSSNGTKNAISRQGFIDLFEGSKALALRGEFNTKTHLNRQLVYLITTRENGV